MRTIEISDYDFDVLSQWASVSRTITQAMHLLEEAQGLDTEDVIHCVAELGQLRQPLDNVNAAAKREIKR